MKKITILAHALSAGGGISVGKNLIFSLQQKLPEFAYQIFMPANLNFEDSIVRPENTQAYWYRKQKNLLGRKWYDAAFVERKINEFEPDLVLCLGNRGVAYRGARQLLLCHDPHLFYPSQFYARETPKKKLVKWFQRRRLARDLKNTDTLFVQTEVAARRIGELFAYRGKTVILPNAVSVDVNEAPIGSQAPELIKQRAAKFKLFYLTRYYPHKNLELLVDLFDAFRDRLSGVCLFLTVEATQHPLANRLLADIERRGLGDSIINVGPLAQAELPTYFSHVDALIMPTTLESFSGTYLEAMSFSCPILTSDLDFARSICGDAALYFNPWDVESLFQALMRLIADPSLGEELRAKGRERLQSFGTTWEENGERLLKAIVEG